MANQGAKEVELILSATSSSDLLNVTYLTQLSLSGHDVALFVWC